MRDIFEDIFSNQPLDPTEAARRAARPVLRKRFYKEAQIHESDGSFRIELDGRPVRTPARQLLTAPTRALAECLAAEWNAQADVIDPARMPLTRLANAVIDAVAAAPEAVAAEIAKFLESDLLCYRAEGPEGLIERQARLWDPVLAWAREALGARFVHVQGVMFAAQPREAVNAARSAIPAPVWRLGAVASITAITGSALLALALAAGAIDAETAWAAAHADEDWQMERWGRDELALAGRTHRRAEFDAAMTVLRLAP